MKKIILTISFLILACIISNNTAFAGCEQSLVGQLRACVNSNHLNIQVVVKDGFVYLDGDSSGPASQGCLNAYNSGAAHCPSAPQLSMSVSGGESSSLTQ